MVFIFYKFGVQARRLKWTSNGSDGVIDQTLMTANC